MDTLSTQIKNLAAQFADDVVTAFLSSSPNEIQSLTSRPRTTTTAARAPRTTNPATRSGRLPKIQSRLYQVGDRFYLDTSDGRTYTSTRKRDLIRRAAARGIEVNV
jgi:hypothetical protein